MVFFVPNISIGFPVVEAVKRYAQKPLDVHLMIVNPDLYIKRFAQAGADILTVHYEACTHLHRTIQSIKSENMKAGVVLNPHSSVSLLEDIVADCDLVLLMSVNPRFWRTINLLSKLILKIEKLKNLILQKKCSNLNRGGWWCRCFKREKTSGLWCRCSGCRKCRV